MRKSCMNCMRRMPRYEGTRRDGHCCSLDPTMRVNSRMFCCQWVSDDLGWESAGREKPFVGAVSVRSITTVKKK